MSRSHEARKFIMSYCFIVMMTTVWKIAHCMKLLLLAVLGWVFSTDTFLAHAIIAKSYMKCYFD